MSRILPFLTCPTLLDRMERFWAKVDMTPDCWNWTAAIGAGGYGVFKLARGITVTAHRFSLVVSTGKDPAGFEACHSCDNPLCVRPEHLRWGTRAENEYDAGRLRDLSLLPEDHPARIAGTAAVLKTASREHRHTPEKRQTRTNPSRNWRVLPPFARNTQAQEAAHHGY